MKSPSSEAKGSLLGAGLVMFLSFAGFSAVQFHAYLFERMGFSPFRIGVLLGLGFTAAIVAPVFQVKTMRRLRGPRRALFLTLACAGLTLSGLPHLHGFLPVAAAFFLVIFFVSGIDPLVTACTLEVTRARGRSTYFIIRCLGTLGVLAGCFVSYFQPRPEFLPRLYLGFGGAFLMALVVALWGLRPADPRQAPEDVWVSPHPRHTPTFRRALWLLSAPRSRRLLWTLGIMNFANAMATLVQGNYLVSRFSGGQRSISLAWMISTGGEIPLMLLCAWLVRRYGLRVVIGMGLLGTTLKLVIIGTAETRGMYFTGLLFHGCFFSGALVGFNLYVDQNYRLTDRPALQALGALFYQGLPAACGGLMAGILWHFLGLRSVYWVSATIGAGVAVYTVFLLPQLPAKLYSQRHP